MILSNLIREVRACANCGRLTTAVTTCPSCQSALSPVEDLVEQLVADVLDQSGRIEIVESAAAALLREHGGLGAFVRY
jgi:peptide subunit release factor 1 (eRF1)